MESEGCGDARHLETPEWWGGGHIQPASLTHRETSSLVGIQRQEPLSAHWGRGGSLLCFLAANYDAHLDGTSGHPGHIRRDHANP